MKKQLLLNIQLFADEEQTEDTPTEQVENNEEEKTSEENAEQEVQNEEKESKTEETSKEPKAEKTPQDEEKERNKKNAQRRILERQKKQEEVRQKQLNEEKRKSYIDGVKKSTNGVNKFTNNPIEDEDDVEEYELMLELEAKGKDPIADYYQAVKEKTRAQKQKQLQEIEAQQKQEQDLNADVDSFIQKYGEDTAQKIGSDEAFLDFANDLFGKVPLSTIYEKYLAIQAKIETKSTEKVIEKEARRMSSPGAPGKGNETAKSWKDLTPEEFHKLSVEIASRR